ncbi:DEAD/DEAH box helicase, partial [uncultured Porphyromonas sp.]|uniref:DEAD/DEAH box helicase n=1 Tax=uncultured Porphyromonas sp. TaxID=159274 RepID=UPI00262ED513
MTFEALGLAEPLLNAIEQLGYEVPTPIQEAVIPLLLGERKDIMALAQTGSGKTAAFGLPMIQNISSADRYPQALIIAPTRELCLQITRDMASYAIHIDDLGIVAVYGGASIEEQIQAVRRGAQVVVATPGRLLDLIRRNAISLEGIKDVVLDEADEMLNMGFIEDIVLILSEIPDERRLLLFSATMPKEIRTIVRQFMREPVEASVGNEQRINKNIRHLYYMVSAGDRYLALKRIADYYPNIYGIIFCKTRRSTQEVASQLIADGYSADALHGELSQAQRDNVMARFRNGTIQLLVATDVAA